MRGAMSTYMNAYSEDYSLDEEGAAQFSALLDGARITFIDAEGNVLADSAAEEVDENHLGRDEVAQAAEEGEGFAVRRSATVGEDFVYFCRRFAAATARLTSCASPSRFRANGAFCRLFADGGGVSRHRSAGVHTVHLCRHILHSAACGETYKAGRALDRIDTRFAELKLLAEILNDRNKDIERKMNEIKEEKELVEKAQNSKNEFISNITHEMNTPLTSIRGYAELLASGMMNEEQQAAAYKTILKQSERLTNLIACIINYNEIDNSDVPACDVDLSKLAREMLAVVKPEADKRQVTLIDDITDNVIVQSTHERMSEMVGNLIRNAIRYNKAGGSVKVTLNIDRFEVADTGIGISKRI